MDRATTDEVKLFYQRRDARLRSRLQNATELIEKVRLLKAIHRNRQSMLIMMGWPIFSTKTLDNAVKSGTIKSQDTSADGGPGSGNFGHEGREGSVGGSKPGGGSGSAAEKDHILGRTASKAAQKVYDNARANEKIITPVLQEISHSIGCEMDGLEFSVKTASSVRSKIERKRKEASDRGEKISDEQIVQRMGDLVRYTEISDHDRLAATTTKTIDRLKEDGFTVVRIENKYLDKKSAYKGIHLDVISPNGQKFELQIHSKESMAVKDQLHPLYEEYREVSTPMERKNQLAQKMFEISMNLPTPKGIEDIQNT